MLEKAFEKMIPYGKHSITEEDISEVIEVLNSDFLTQGPKVPDFENSLVKYTGGKYACAVNSATSALHVACLALELKAGDSLWTSPITFVASANAGLYCQANIDFVDIDPKTFNICPSKLLEKLHLAKKEGKLPKILVVVHLAGTPTYLKQIYDLCSEFGIKIIEDASHAIGASYCEDKVGSCKFSDITVFSFHPVKIITTAEGGAALTNDPILAKKMEQFRTHGITREKNQFVEKNPEEWHYEQVRLGFNYRMNDIQAALGISQLKKLDHFVSERNEIASYYSERLVNEPISFQLVPEETLSSYHLFVIRVKENIRNKLFRFLRDQGILVNLHYSPVHLQPFYRKMGFKNGDFLEAESYSRTAISIPIYPDLRKQDLDYVINKLKNSGL